MNESTYKLTIAMLYANECLQTELFSQIFSNDVRLAYLSAIDF